MRILALLGSYSIDYASKIQKCNLSTWEPISNTTLDPIRAKNLILHTTHILRMKSKLGENSLHVPFQCHLKDMTKRVKQRQKSQCIITRVSGGGHRIGLVFPCISVSVCQIVSTLRVEPFDIPTQQLV